MFSFFLVLLRDSPWGLLGLCGSKLGNGGDFVILRFATYILFTCNMYLHFGPWYIILASRPNVVSVTSLCRLVHSLPFLTPNLSFDFVFQKNEMKSGPDGKGLEYVSFSKTVSVFFFDAFLFFHRPRLTSFRSPFTLYDKAPLED